MPSNDPHRPNILFILSDDQGAWALGCAGNREIRTPNLDRLAAEGMRFQNFFCASPVCSPARASILTGRIPSQHGIHDWLRAGNMPNDLPQGGDSKPIEYLRGMTGYTDVLAAHGYTCGISGKWHLGDSAHPQKGFSYWQVHSRGGSGYYNAPMLRNGVEYNEPRYVTDTIAENAIEFLRGQERSDAPFYLSVHYTAPHSPWTPDEHPAATYDDYHANCPFKSTPFEPMHPWQIASAPSGFDEPSRRRELSGYYTAVTEMDRTIGTIIEELDRQGIRESTLVVFTSDNGMNMGHHGLYGKGNATFPANMFDTSVKVPAIISRPGAVPCGVVRDEMLSHYDIFPTLLDYVGVENPVAGDIPGASFAPILRGEPTEPRDSVVVYDEYGPTRMIRTREWKYVHRFPYGPHELYRLTEDPDERDNIVDHEDATAVLLDLRERLSEWFVQWADPARDGSREPVKGVGQQDLAGPAGRGVIAFNQAFRFLRDSNG
jgi:arylsulfatase A-like enzyme